MHLRWAIPAALFTIVANAASPPTSPALQAFLNDAYKAPYYTYPTSLTQGIIPKYIHSHNDYWRPVPFYSALSAGAVSIEADVWLYNETLLVGHEPSALTMERTLQSLYIDPVMDVLEAQNPSLPAEIQEMIGTTHNGVFDTNAQQTLYLFIDVKTDGLETWPYVLKALEPLRSAGYLTTTNSSSQITSSAVTVIGTGNTPLSLIQPLTERYYFYDAPISTLATTFSNITSLVSPIASTSFTKNFGTVDGTSLNKTGLALLRSQVKTAHGKGIKLRYWDQPGWPISTRNGIWRQLKSEGVDFINVDDLEAAAGLSDESNTW